MAYLQWKQIAQYIMGWACFLPPNPLTALTDAEQLIPTSVQTHAAVVTTWENAYDDWRIKDNMAMGVIKGTLHGQYLTYVVHCAMLKVVWDAILGRLKTQNLGLAVHNTKQLMYNHPYLRGPIEEYLKHFAVTNEQLACISKALPDSDIAHWMLENLLKDDPSWKSIISSFYMVNPDPDLVTSFQASVAIWNHYNQLTAPPAHLSSAYIAPTFESVFAAHHGCPLANLGCPSSASLGCPFCSGCNKPGHPVDKCFNLILSEIDKLNSCLPCSLQLSLPAKSERVNVLSDGDCAEQDVLDDRDAPDNEDDTVLLAMALKNREVFISALLNGKSKSAYHDHAYVDSGVTCSISPVIQYFNPASLKQLRAPVIICVGNNDMLLWAIFCSSSTWGTLSRMV